MTQEDLARIHAAMTESNGDRGLAAAVLQCTLDQLRWHIGQTPELKARWGLPVPTPYSEVESLTRDLEPVEVQKASAIGVESSMIRSRGVADLGLSPEQAELASKLAAFNQEHYLDSMNITQGGATRTFVVLVGQIDRLEARIKDVQVMLANPAACKMDGFTEKGELYELGDWEKRQALSEEESRLYKSFTDVSAQIANFGKLSHASASLIASIRQKLHGIRSNQIKTKPGFSDGPPPIQTHPPTTPS